MLSKRLLLATANTLGSVDGKLTPKEPLLPAALLTNSPAASAASTAAVTADEVPTLRLMVMIFAPLSMA